MSEPTAHTSFGDAPLSTARNPDVTAAADFETSAAGEEHELVGRTVTIARPREELYDFWRDFANLPTLLPELAEVQVIDRLRSHWAVEGPAGSMVEWDSIVTSEDPGRAIAWRSAPGSDVANSGRIEFRDAPAGRGTEVTVTMLYDPPAGAAGKLMAKLFQREPKLQARRALRRFKQLMEAGEISTAQPPHTAPRA